MNPLLDIGRSQAFVHRSTPLRYRNVSWPMKVQALARELNRRHRTFPKLVEAGKLTQAEADQEIATFEAILSNYWDDLLTIRLAGAEDELNRRTACITAGIDPLTFTDPARAERTAA